jgi:Domain of unknown function (DUF222)/HNH endonuclease
MCSIEIHSAAPPGASPELETLPLEWLEREITELAAHINAATCRWLVLVGEFDHREGWADWGCRSCSHWLSYHCGLSPATGREQVRVARSLADLPAVRAAFARGELCYSQVRALTRIATAETERDLLVVARHATAGQLEVIVRAYRGVLATAAGVGQAERYVRCDHDDDGSLLLRARLPAEEGALVLAALEAGRDAIREGRAPRPGRADADDVDPGAGVAETAGGSASAETTQIGDSEAADTERGHNDALGNDARAEPPTAVPPAAGAAVSNADALVLMAETLLCSGAAERGGDGYQVVVHVDAATLAHEHDGDGDGACQLEHGSALHPETARRLACDSSLVRILERDGRPLSVGRKTRTIPPALRRALSARDPVCRFPGCPQRRFLHAHHVQHWAQGGRTDLSNLIHLCSHHHRLVHEHGYTIERGHRGALRFRRPDGRALPTTISNATSDPDQLQHHNHQHRLHITDRTCVPIIYPGDRLDLDWQIAGLAEHDSRLTPKHLDRDRQTPRPSAEEAA